ncbi:hypothetical protein K443DRAFT_174449 [Laccaria amethystina LaAM-08-1]|uniref:Uncharacterized protein n=1 Tax=Laccaria amethystina LaAM-08-1 TaxID=1095629 RepID=A0A0C9XP83_9AGAR|nr:hypothetical protein K443DRAFT_174449 [Laccaria amethystina LaAM-08-1]
MLNILLSLNQWDYPLWELQMTTKHGGHLPGSNGVKENNSEHGAKDDCWFPDILMLQRLKRSRSVEVHRESSGEDSSEYFEMSSQPF